MKNTERVADQIKQDNRIIIAEVDKALQEKDLQIFMSYTKDIRRRANRLRASDLPRVGDLSDIPKEFAFIGDEKFLRYNEKLAQGRILIFASDHGLQTLKSCDQWHGDGTFDTAPDPFYQVYPIFGSFEGSKHLIPCAFCLLPDKKAETYEVRGFTILKLFLWTIK